MSRLFISHSSHDNFEALAFKQWLTAEGWSSDDVFLDMHGIGAGSRWKEALAKANERCEAVLFLISPYSLQSNECYVELRMAEDMGKVIVPAILPARVPEDKLAIDDQRLGPHRDRQIVDTSIEPREAAFTVEHEGQRKTITFHAPTLARIKARLDQLGISPDSFAWTPADLETATPYPGLAGFSQGEAALFFGRAGDLARGFGTLRKLRRAALDGGQGALLVIQAASGAGKSSFLRAGLWPRLLRDPDFTPIGILRPATGILTGDTGIGRQFSAFFARNNKPRPAAEIHLALRGQDAGAALTALVNETAEIGRETQRLANPDAPPPMPVIAVDQAEELFASEDAEESRRFLAMLAGLMGTGPTAAAKPVHPPLLVWTVRADSMDTLLHATTAHSLGTPELLPLPPIPRTSFGEIINGPLAVANRSGMRLSMDPLLTQKLIEVSDGADALPLLAFTLRQLVEENRAGSRAQITLDAFETSGGIDGVLRKRLAAAQRKAGAAEAQLRALFVPHLATWDADARPPAAKRLVADEAELFTGERANLSPLADALVEERLLTRSGGEDGRATLEVAHEALLRQPPLAEWLEEAREFLVWRDGIGRARRGFEANTRPLLMGRELEIARAWLDAPSGRDLAPQDRGFIENSLAAKQRARAEEAERERQRQQAELAAAQAREEAARDRADAARRVARRTLVGLAAALVLAVAAAGAGWFAWLEGGRARKQEAAAQQTSREAQITQSGLLSEAAREISDKLNGGDAPTALLLALEGMPDATSDDPRMKERPPVVATQVQLDRAFRGNKEKAILPHDDWITAVAWSPDGRLLATGSRDNTARIVEAVTGRETARVTHDGWVRAVAWRPDGRLLATGSDDKTARIVEAATGRETARVTHDGRVTAVAWSPDGRLLATGSDDNTARIVEAATGRETARVVHDGWVAAVAWSPDGSPAGLAILTGSHDKTARLWRVSPTAQHLVTSAKERAARCLTQAQRAQYFLPAAPPTWCVERRLWPYHGDEWQAWLPKRKAWLASGREGPEPELPKAQ